MMKISKFLIFLPSCIDFWTFLRKFAAMVDIEKTLKLLWESGVIERCNLKFYADNQYKIIDRGMPIEGTKYQFSSAQLLNTTTGEVITGEVKINERSSDWHEEQTINDNLHKNVVIHLVTNKDTDHKYQNKSIITIEVEINNKIIKFIEDAPNHCPKLLAGFTEVERTDILQRLLDDRVARKVNEMLTPYTQGELNWEEMSHLFFFRAVGIPGEHKMQCQAVAEAVPLKFFKLHHSRPNYAIAVLLGVAGLLPMGGDIPNSYIGELNEMYSEYLKYGGATPLPLKWNNSGSLNSSPQLSLVRCAVLLCKELNYIDKILHIENLSEMREYLQVELPEFWQKHSSPTKQLAKHSRELTTSRINLLIINFVIPLLFAYAFDKNDNSYQLRAMRFYEELPPEAFSMLKRWKTDIWKPRSTFETQALVQLTAMHCKGLHCSGCPIIARAILKLI